MKNETKDDKEFSETNGDSRPRIIIFDPEIQKRKEQEETLAILGLLKWKLISLGIALFYLFFGYLTGGGEGFFKMFLFLLLPMSLIWFSDVLGRHTGSSWGLGGSVVRGIDAPSPAGIVKFMGWAILLYPIISAFIALLV